MRVSLTCNRRERKTVKATLRQLFPPRVSRKWHFVDQDSLKQYRCERREERNARSRMYVYMPSFARAYVGKSIPHTPRARRQRPLLHSGSHACRDARSPGAAGLWDPGVLINPSDDSLARSEMRYPRDISSGYVFKDFFRRLCWVTEEQINIHTCDRRSISAP